MVNLETMKGFIYLTTAFLVFVFSSCSKSSSHYNQVIYTAERLMQSNADSAMSLLETMDPTELTIDSLRAKYHYLKGWGHMRQNRSMIGDSLIVYANNYYRGKDKVKEIRSATAHAWYKFWAGDIPGSIAMLDSLVSLSDVPDSLMVHTLRVRLLLGASEYQGQQIIPLSKTLYTLETDTLRKIEAQCMLLAGYEYAEETDSALYLVDELINYAHSHSWGDKQFMFMVEKAQLLTESGRDSESDRIIDYIFTKAGPENGAADLLHFQYAINALNRGDLNRATYHLTIADSIALKFRGDDDAHFRSYSNLLHAMIDFKQTGRIKLMHINGLNNRQSERFNRAKASQWETERAALQQQNRTLALKADNEHKAVVILIISIVALLIAGGSVWIFTYRRQRERENEERVEALQKMINELKSAPAPMETEVHTPEALRRVMLQQLGIIKMVAETPTEQNREMLRKISSIESDTGGELVNWSNVFELINTLYSGFYDKLKASYGKVLTPKEEQIIVLMVAGFSTKEISVITGQTTSTIYVRKSSIRKKCGVPEKEDILTSLQEWPSNKTE